MIKAILWDIDATLLNFEMAEKAAFYKCFQKLGLGECNDTLLKQYAVINCSYWERLERNEITKQEVLVQRFTHFFTKENISLAGKTQVELAEAFNEEYQKRLADTVFFCDNGYELLLELKGKVKQYAVTNGTAVAQHKKLENAKLKNIFDGIFISDELGVEKPNRKFFEKVWESVGRYKSGECMIVGDSLTSDMQGGKNAGILCCWYNPGNKENTTGIELDYQIHNLWEVKDIFIQNSEKK